MSSLLVGCELIPQKKPVFIPKPPVAKPVIVEIAPKPEKPLLAPLNFRIALLAPFSGQHEALGEKVLNGASMALYENPRNYGVKLYPIDTMGTVEGAGGAIKAALKTEPHLIIGPVFSANVTTAAPIAKKAEVNLLALSNDQNVATPEVFVMGAHPESEMEIILKKAKENGWKKVLYYGPDNAYGNRLTAQLENLAPLYPEVKIISASFPPITDVTTLTHAVRTLTQFEKRVGQLHEFLSYSQEAWEKFHKFDSILPVLIEKTGFLETPTIDESLPLEEQAELMATHKKLHKAQEGIIEDMARCLSHFNSLEMDEEKSAAAIEKMLASFASREVLGNVEFDAVILPLQGGQLKMIASLLDFFYASAPEVTLVGTSIWKQTEGLSREPSLKKAWYLSNGEGFSYDQESRFREFFHQEPQPISVLAFDAVNLAKDIYSLTGIKDRSFLENHKFTGESGTFAFKANGTNEWETKIVPVERAQPLMDLIASTTTSLKKQINSISDEQMTADIAQIKKPLKDETFQNMCGLGK